MMAVSLGYIKAVVITGWVFLFCAKGLLKCSSHLTSGCGLSRAGTTATAGMAMAVLAWEGEMDSDL